MGMTLFFVNFPFPRCVEKVVDHYTYKLCFFDFIEQLDRGHPTRLGTYSPWSNADYSAMQYSGGQMCPGGPSRSAVVRFECGIATALLAVSEPSRCVYEAKVATPGACREAGMIIVLHFI
jgi:protein kinase C substrate 80K-H